MERPETLCIICGVEAVQHYAGNKNLPLCALASCEGALENEINGIAQVAAAEAVEGEVV